MIFLTVGTTKYPFRRLLQSVDNFLMNSKTKEKLIAQVGMNDYRFRYRFAETYVELPFKKMVRNMVRARLLICHGGAGTLLLALRYAKNKPLVFPRMAKLKEHIDDHQVFFCNFLQKKKLIDLIVVSDNLNDAFFPYVEFHKKLFLKTQNLNLKKLTNALTDYTK